MPDHRSGPNSGRGDVSSFRLGRQINGVPTLWMWVKIKIPLSIPKIKKICGFAGP